MLENNRKSLINIASGAIFSGQKLDPLWDAFNGTFSPAAVSSVSNTSLSGKAIMIKRFSHEPRQFDFFFPAALMRNIEAIHLCEKTHVGFLQSSRDLPSSFFIYKQKLIKVLETLNVTLCQKSIFGPKK